MDLRRRLVPFAIILVLFALTLPMIALRVPGAGGSSARAATAPRAVSDQGQFIGEDVLQRIMQLAADEKWANLPIGERMARIGLALRGTPYVANTLEVSVDHEIPVVNLSGLDCVTFFEVSLAMAHMLDKGEKTPAQLLDRVAYARYRDGKIGDYATRLHYTADWFFNNQEKGLLKDITRELPGAERFDKKIDFMSTHPDAYRQLKANAGLVPKIREVEQRINSRKMWYVPKAKVAAVEPLLRSGDIVAVTTTIGGIDASHTGMIYRDENGSARFLHASLTQKQVILDTTLSGYLASVSKHTGVMIARPR